jgi:hypothetical protein
MQAKGHRRDLLQAAGGPLVEIPSVLHQDRIRREAAQIPRNALSQTRTSSVRLEGLFGAGGQGDLLEAIAGGLLIRLPSELSWTPRDQAHLMTQGRQAQGLHVGHALGAAL